MNHIISDVHGCYYTLLKLVDKIYFADKNAQLIFIGDYVDRGLYSRETVDYLIKLQSEGAICLRGNHDDVIDFILNAHSVSSMKEHVVGPPIVGKVVNWWMWNGLLATLLSYDALTYQDNMNSFQTEVDIGNFIAEDLKNKVPEEHKTFFQGLPLYWENDTHFAVHAYMRPKEELPRSLKFLKADLYEEILWSRFPSFGKNFLATSTVWDKIGVFGHSPTNKVYNSPTPIKYDKIRLIDTGACFGGYLCSYCCEQDDWLLQDVDSRDIEEKNESDSSLAK